MIEELAKDAPIEYAGLKTRTRTQILGLNNKTIQLVLNF